MPHQDPEISRWFTEQVQPHERYLRGYLCALTGSSDIDDIVQETYVRVLRARESRKIESPRGLLVVTARNVARDLFRRYAVARTSSVADVGVSNVLDSAPEVPEVVSRRQELDLLRTAVRALPARCREIFVLRKFENLSHREIAQRLGISENTVEGQLTKGLTRCEKFFARNGALPPK